MRRNGSHGGWRQRDRDREEERDKGVKRSYCSTGKRLEVMRMKIAFRRLDSLIRLMPWRPSLLSLPMVPWSTSLLPPPFDVLVLIVRLLLSVSCLPS